MSEQLRREGPELEPLLASLHAEHGADMRIVSAEKVRAGGVLGFFARQTFAVVIETSRGGLPPVEAPDPAPPPPAAAPALDFDSSGLLLARVEEVNAQEAPVRVGGPDFADVLAELMAAEDYRPLAAAPEPEPDAVTPDLTRRLAVFPRVERPVPGAPPEPIPPEPTDGADDADADDVPALDTLPERAAAAPAELEGATEPVPASVDSATHGRTQVTARPASVSTRPRPGEVVAVVGDAAVVEGQVAALLRCWLLELPHHGSDGSTGAAGTPPPSAVAVAVIDGRRRELSGLPGVRGLRLLRAAQAAPVVVVVPVAGRGPLGAGALQDAVETLAALRPDRIVAVVDATRKDEDVRAWLDSLPGVDALAVHGAQDSTSPWSVLAHGLPVLCLDGRPATADRWAALGAGTGAGAGASTNAGALASPAPDEPSPNQAAPDRNGLRGRRRLSLAAPHGAA